MKSTSTKTMTNRKKVQYTILPLTLTLTQLVLLKAKPTTWRNVLKCIILNAYRYDT